MLNQKLIDKIHEIERIRNKNKITLTLNENNKLQFISDVRTLATKQYGLYWFETDATDNDLLNVSIPSDYALGLVPMKSLASRRILYPTKTNPDGMRVVYNGIRTDIRSRIQSHIRNTGNGTGRLGINAYPELMGFKWSVSYYILDPQDYELHSGLFETGWRGHYGFPILCRE